MKIFRKIKHTILGDDRQLSANQLTNPFLKALRKVAELFRDSGVVFGGLNFDAYGGDNMFRDGDYVVSEFLNSGNFVVTRQGTVNYTTLDTLIVAGGGAGGGGVNYCGGGGGAGGYFFGTVTPSVTSYPVVIGAGGSIGSGADSSAGNGGNGSNSTFNGLTAIGGGGGGETQNGLNGGCGGGAGTEYSSRTGGVGSQGFNGGDWNEAGSGGPFSAGGGGGIGQAGGTAIGLNTAFGAGGNGLQFSISGTPIYYGGGGGGGSIFAGSSSAVAGGLGGGGNGGFDAGAGGTSSPGQINTGGGGGGGGQTTSSPNINLPSPGGSGVAYTRYYNPSPFAGIKSLYSFESSNGNDSISQTANNGTVHSSITFPSSGIVGTKCARLNGSFHGRIELSPIGIVGTSSSTIFAWVKCSPNPNNHAVFGWGQENVGRAAFCYINTTGKVSYDLYGIGVVTGSTSVDNNTWNLLAWVNNNGNLSVYVNGVLDGTGTPFTMDIGNNYAWIGDSYSGSSVGFTGDIDYVGIVPRVLSATELLAIYNGGLGQTYF